MWCNLEWCSGYHYCTTSFIKAWIQVLCRFNPAQGALEIGDGENVWQSSRLEITLRLSSVNHTTETTPHHHHHHHHQHQQAMNIWRIMITKIESSHLAYLDANNLYGWAMSQKLPVNGFKWVEKSSLSRFNETFIKNYNENSDKGYFFEVDIDYLKELFNLQKYLPFLPERKKVNKCEKLICSIENKKSYTYKSFKTSTKSRFKIKKGTQNN